MSPQRRWPWVAVPVAVLILATGLRLWGLAQPNGPYWDERHYVYDANAYLGGGFGIIVGHPPPVRIASEGTWVHPPLGKWMIALLGVGPFGLHPFGWRVPSVVFGVAGVMLLYLLALELWGSVYWAGLAALLLSFDGLHIVQSRLAMLDIFLTTFLTAGFLFLVMDLKREDRTPPEDRAHGLLVRVFGSKYRFWAGFMFGAAIACKWAGVFGLAFAIVLSLVRLGSGAERDRRSRLTSLGTVAASFLLVPIGVYLVSYGAFFYQHGLAIHDFLILQLRMLQFHEHHTQVQPENSLPWTWPFLLHPIQYWNGDRGSSVQRIVALGNPVIWWGLLALLPVAIFNAIRRPAWQDAIVFGGYASMYVPWLFVGRTQFIFYMLPAVPFMCLGIISALRGLPLGIARASGVAFGAAAVIVGAAFAPIWLGLRIGPVWSGALRWLPRWPV
jgi:dolichyl-phosphate-mannose-protein mannosyltransferase